MGMVLIPGGEFLMGTDDKAGFPADGEGPIRKVRVNAFYIDECAVTYSHLSNRPKAEEMIKLYAEWAERCGVMPWPIPPNAWNPAINGKHDHIV